MPRKILITGPESSGKTTLCQMLGSELQAQIVPEFARQYLERGDGSYVESDLLRIAKGQLRLEKDAERSDSDWIICDTSLEVIRIWADDKYGKVDSGIEKMLSGLSYDLVFLCKPDFPWTSDPLRENPDKGEHFFNRFQSELIALNWKFYVASGSVEDRLKGCMEIIRATI